MHSASGSFWESFNSLPESVREIARQQYELMKLDPNHPSLHLKRVQQYWSVRVNQEYRALGFDVSDGILWFWIGNHKEYERRINK